MARSKPGPTGQTLKRLREDAGLSQRKLGMKAGVDPSYINKLERGARKTMSMAKARKLAAALDLPVTAFFEPASIAVTHARSVGALLKEAAERYETLQVLEVPIVGNAPDLMPEETEEAEDMGYLHVPRGELPEGEESFFALRVNDRALEGDGINQGDFVIVSRDQEIIDGKVYAVALDSKVILRHVHREGEHLILTASSLSYAPLLVSSGYTILGRVVLSGLWQRH